MIDRVTIIIDRLGLIVGGGGGGGRVLQTPIKVPTCSPYTTHDLAFLVPPSLSAKSETSTSCAKPATEAGGCQYSVTSPRGGRREIDACNRMSPTVFMGLGERSFGHGENKLEHEINVMVYFQPGE